MHECRCWDTAGASAVGRRTGDTAVTAGGEGGQHSAPTPSLGAGCSQLYPSGRRGAGTPSSGAWGCIPFIGVQPWMGGMLQGPPAGRGSQVQIVLPLFTKHWMMWRFIQSNLCSGDLAGHGASSLLSSCAQPCIPLSPCVLAGVQDSPPSPCQGFRPAHCHRLTAPGQIPQGKTPTPCCAGAGEYREAKPPGSHGRVLLGRLSSTSLPRRSAKSFALNPDLQRAGARGSARFWFEERRGPHSALFEIPVRTGWDISCGAHPGHPRAGAARPPGGTRNPRTWARVPGEGTRGRVGAQVLGEGWVRREGGCRYLGKVGRQVPREGGCTGTVGVGTQGW